VHADYLSVLAQSHSDFLFGAFAELLHNSTDSGATQIDIDIVKPISGSLEESKWPSYMLCIRDNGCGMNLEALERMMRFGKQQHTNTPDHLAGKYGIGFKSGASRLSRYATVVTKKRPTTSDIPSASRALMYMSLLNPACHDADGVLMTPTIAVNIDNSNEAPKEQDAEEWKCNSRKIEEHSKVNPYRWIMEFHLPMHGSSSKRDYGTSVYLQSLKGEESYSKANVDGGEADLVEWKIDEEAKDIYHIRKEKFKRTREGQVLAERVDIDWSLRKYIEAMYQYDKLPQGKDFTITLLGEKIKTTSIVKREDFTPLCKTPLPPTLSRSSSSSAACSTFEVGFIPSLHRDGLCGVHIYHRRILIESYLHVSFSPTDSCDHGYLGVLTLEDDWQLSPLNHKQGFSKSSSRYAELQDKLKKVYQTNVKLQHDRERTEARKTRDFNVRSALAKINSDDTEDHRKELFLLFTLDELKLWGRDYEEDVIKKPLNASDTTKEKVAQLFAHERVQLPHSLLQLERWIQKDAEESGGLFVECEKCHIDRLLSSKEMHDRYRSPTERFTCASEPTLELKCGSKRPQDGISEDHVVVESSSSSYSPAVPSTPAVSSSSPSTVQPSLLYEVSKGDFSYNKSDPESRLGSGAYGTVFLGEWAGSLVAIKELNDGKYRQDVYTKFRSEVQVLAQLHHPLLVRMLFYCKEPLVIGFEYLPGFKSMADIFPVAASSSSSSLSSKASDVPTIEDKIAILLDIAKGMSFMHSREFLHCDLCPSNILIRYDQQNKVWNVKIIDMGLAAAADKERRGERQRSTGQPDNCTVAYKAPERFAKAKMILKASDVFSFGVVAFELLSGTAAWPDKSYEDIRDAITRGKMPSLKSSGIAHVPLHTIIANCWLNDPSIRSDFAKIVLQLKSIQFDLLHGLEGWKGRHGSSVVYRVLHKHDLHRIKKNLPLIAHDPNSNMSLSTHVRHGCKNEEPSPFTSTTTSFSWAVHYACKLMKEKDCASCARGCKCARCEEKWPEQHFHGAIVAIDLSGLTTLQWKQTFDLTSERLAEACGFSVQRDVLHVRYCVDAQEVLFRCELPLALIKHYYLVQSRHISQSKTTSKEQPLPSLGDSGGKPIPYGKWVHMYNRLYENKAAELMSALHVSQQQLFGSSQHVPFVKSSSPSGEPKRPVIPKKRATEAVTPPEPLPTKKAKAAAATQKSNERL
jgi:serine/threonine protein kinase